MGTMKTTLKNTILALMMLAPAGAAFAAGSGMEAVGACPQCEMGSRSGNGLQAIPVSVNTHEVAGSTSAVSALAVSDLSNLANRLGRVETKNPITADGKTGISTANGVMVSPCYMLTNYHVVFGDEKDPNPQSDHSVYFYIGRGSTAFKYRLEGQPVHWGAKSGAGSQDYALVYIPKCPGKVLGWVEPKPVVHEQLKGASMTMAVIPAMSADGKIETSSCTGIDREQVSNLLDVTCPIQNGHSGGALMIHDQQTGFALVGLNQSVGSSGAFRAITLNEILNDPDVAGLLATDKQTFAEAQRASTVRTALRATTDRSL